MKKLYCLLLLSFSYFNTLAQATWCRAQEPTQAEKRIFLQKYHAVESARARQAAETVTYVALKIHLLSKTNGAIEVPGGKINELIDSLNAHFIGANIQFYQCGEIDNIKNDRYYTFNTNDEAAFANVYDVNNAINVYLVKQFSDAGLGGYAYFPSTKKTTNRIFCAYNNLSDLITKILPHEMGHYFGLIHTFQDSNFEGYAELVTRGDKSNCAYRGDLLCDTPADPYGRGTVSIQNCQFNSTSLDANGESYAPQLGNLMSYYRGCGNFFTQGQQSMMKTGLLIRMIQDSDRSQAYSINCKGVSSNVIMAQDIYINGTKQNPYTQICVEKPFTVTFSTEGSFNSNNEYKVFLVAENATYSTEIGSGTGTQINCKIPAETPLTANRYRIQIVSNSPVIHSTLSNIFFYVTKIPTIELAGSYNLFENESVSIPVKASGGHVSVELSNNINSSMSFTTFINPAITITARKSETITVNRVFNNCGYGTGKGQLEINVDSKPVAKSFIIENISSKTFCAGTTIKLALRADGLFNTRNTFRVKLSDKNGENFQDIVLQTDVNKVLELPIADDLPEGTHYRIKVISSNPYIEYETPDISILSKATASLSGNYVINNGEKANLIVQLTGQPPFTLETMNGETIVSQSNEYQWSVSPSETSYYTLKSVSNGSCLNGKVSGNASIKVNYPLKTSIVPFASACAGEVVKVPFSTEAGVVLGNGLIVQLSDSKGVNFRNIATGGFMNPLEAVIPADITDGDKYRLRVISRDGRYIGSESNEFSIKKKPVVYLEGAIAGNKGTQSSFPLKLSGGGPWKVKLSSDGQDTEYTVDQSPYNLPVTIQKNSVYKLGSVSNACGVGVAYGQAVSTVQNGAAEYCLPVDNTGYSASGKIARVRITDAGGHLLLNSFEMKIGKGRYTDNTNMVANLKPGSTYTFDLVNSDFGTEYSFQALSYNFIMWIDYDQNGKFDKSEIIVSNERFHVNGEFKIPENAKKGVTRMRVRTYQEENLPDNPCAQTNNGETEDYSIFITDDAPLYSAEIKITEPALCKTIEYDLSFVTKGSFAAQNIFRVALYDNFGLFIGYIGEGKTSPVKIKFPTDLPIGANYKMKIVGTEPYFEGIFSPAFRINEIPKALVSGNQIVYLGEAIPVEALVDGGGDWYVTMANGYTTTLGAFGNKLSIDVPADFMYSITKPGDYEFKIGRVVNAGCGDGRVIGSAKVKVLDPSSTSGYVSKIALSTWQIQKCKNSASNITISFNTKGTFGKKNFFTAHLIDANDNFVAIAGYSKANSLIATIPDNIVGLGYKFKIVSSDPYTESSLSESINIAPVPKANISGYSEILAGEPAAIKLDIWGDDYGNVGLSDGTLVMAMPGSQTLKVSPAVTTTYTIKSVESNYCMGDVAGSATVKVLQPRASKLSISQPVAYCVGSVASLPIKQDGSFREKNKFIVRLTNINRRVSKEIDAVLTADNNVVFNVPADLASGDGYKLQLISTSPYIETEVSEAFALKPESTAIISSETKTVYEKSQIRLRIDFIGDGPYNIRLSDRSTYTNITQNPFFIDKNTDLKTTRYTIDSVSSVCGTGKTLGLVELKVLPLPVITTKTADAQAICKNMKVHIPFAISNGAFQPDNTFKVEIAQRANGAFKEVPTTMQGDSLFVTIPPSIALGTQFIRVKGTSPLVDGSAVQIIVKGAPVAEIYGYGSVIAGDSVWYNITNTGDIPWSFKLSNGTEQKGISETNFYSYYVPKKSEELFIASVGNACGEGTFKGKATFVVYSPEEIEGLVKVFPNPYEPNTGLYIDRALLKNRGELIITDVSGKELKREAIQRGYMPLDLTEYPRGLYYLRVSVYGKQFVRKILK